MTIQEIFDDLIKECWTFESWSEHPPSKLYYTVKLCCGAQARGRLRSDGETFEIALRTAYKDMLAKFGRVGGIK